MKRKRKTALLVLLVVLVLFTGSSCKLYLQEHSDYSFNQPEYVDVFLADSPEFTAEPLDIEWFCQDLAGMNLEDYRAYLKRQMEGTSDTEEDYLRVTPSYVEFIRAEDQGGELYFRLTGLLGSSMDRPLNCSALRRYFPDSRLKEEGSLSLEKSLEECSNYARQLGFVREKPEIYALNREGLEKASADLDAFAGGNMNLIPPGSEGWREEDEGYLFLYSQDYREVLLDAGSTLGPYLEILMTKKYGLTFLVGKPLRLMETVAEDVPLITLSEIFQKNGIDSNEIETESLRFAYTPIYAFPENELDSFRTAFLPAWIIDRESREEVYDAVTGARVDTEYMIGAWKNASITNLMG